MYKRENLKIVMVLDSRLGTKVPPWTIFIPTFLLHQYIFNLQIPSQTHGFKKCERPKCELFFKIRNTPEPFDRMFQYFTHKM